MLFEFEIATGLRAVAGYCHSYFGEAWRLNPLDQGMGHPRARLHYDFGALTRCFKGIKAPEVAETDWFRLGYSESTPMLAWYCSMPIF